MCEAPCGTGAPMVAAAESVPILTPVRASVPATADRKSTRLNSSHLVISYAVFCLKKNRRVERGEQPLHRDERLLPQLNLYLPNVDAHAAPSNGAPATGSVVAEAQQRDRIFLDQVDLQPRSLSLPPHRHPPAQAALTCYAHRASIRVGCAYPRDAALARVLRGYNAVRHPRHAPADTT